MSKAREPEIIGNTPLAGKNYSELVTVRQALQHSDMMYNLALKIGKQIGEQEGARRERRALKRYLDTEPVSEATELRLWLRYVRPAQLKRRSKAKSEATPCPRPA